MTKDYLVSFAKYTLALIGMRSIMHILVMCKLESVEEKRFFIKRYWISETIISVLIALTSIILFYLPWPFESTYAYTTTLALSALVPFIQTFNNIRKDGNNAIFILKSSLFYRRMHTPLFSAIFPLSLIHLKSPTSFKVAIPVCLILITLMQYFGFNSWISTLSGPKIKSRHSDN